MSYESNFEMEIVSDTGSSDTTTISGHSEEDEEAVRPQPLLSAIINQWDRANSPGAAAAADEDDDSNDATQPYLEMANPSNGRGDGEASMSSAAAALNVSTSDEDGQMCTICLEPWTSSGEHRLISLRCGHLFGRSCISRWLQGQGSRCPQCNARARKSEIRPIFARCLKVLDTTERDRALRELENEMVLRKKAELDCAQLRMKVQLATLETENLKKQLQDTQCLLNDSRWASNSLANNLSSNKAKPASPAFTLLSKVDLQGCCRVFDCNDMLGVMVISQPSYNALFHGYGFKKIAIPEMRLCEYVHLHQKPIKDIAFHPHNGLVLTASLDKTVKLTNCLNNSLVQMYNLECEAWSCAWDSDDPCYFFAGVRTGAVYIFDIRMTDRHVDYLTNVTEMSPVVSIQYLKRRPSSPHSGPIVGQLFSCCYYEKKSPTAYEVSPTPLEGKFTSLSYDVKSNHLLASFRPSAKHPLTTHSLCEVEFRENTFNCNLVQCITAGRTQSILSRSKLIPHPTNQRSVLICAGDEEESSALIWDGSTGERLISLKTDSPILDITTFQKEQKPLLATLTERELRVYNWTGD